MREEKMFKHDDIENSANGHNKVGRRRWRGVETWIFENIWEEILIKKKIGRKPQWSITLTDDLLNIILQNVKFKEKLLLTNVKISKNSQCYQWVTDELKGRCKQRDSISTHDLNQTREKFKPQV